MSIREKSLSIISNSRKNKSNNCPPTTLIGHIDLLDNNVLKGWVFDNENRLASIDIDVRLDDQKIGCGRADIFREDLEKLGYGSGCHGFHIPLSREIFQGIGKTLSLSETVTDKPVRTNKFSLNPARVIGVEFLSSTQFSINGVAKLSERSACPMPLVLMTPDNRQLTDENDCSWRTDGDTSHFTISTVKLQNQKINRFYIAVPACASDFKDNVYCYSNLAHEHSDWLREVFFAPYYLYTNNIDSVSVNDAFDHYLSHGIYKDFNPNPWVNSEYIRKRYSLSIDDIPLLSYRMKENEGDAVASPLFSAEQYRTANSDIGTISPLYHLCKYGVNQNRLRKKPRYSDAVLKEIAQVSEYEPDISFHQDVIVHQLPNIHRGTYLPEILAERIGDNTDVLVCVPFISIGGADYIATQITEVVGRQIGYSNVTVLVTDSVNMAGAHWLSEDIKVVVIEEIFAGFPTETKSAILHKAVANICPSKIINVNSHVCWEMYENFGRFLKQYVDLYSYIFCFDFNDQNKPVGYVPDYLESTIDYLSAIFSDNQAYIDQIFDIYGYASKYRSKFHCAYTPYERKLPAWTGSKSKGKLLWCGRLCRQKKIELLVEISSLVPDIEIDVYGPVGDSEYSSDIANSQYSNLVYRGVYSDISELDLSQYNAFLYTANWDGLPVVLINMMAAGMPIVSSNVGGINELLKSTNSYLVDDTENVNEYVQAIVDLCYMDADVVRLSGNAVADVTEANNLERYSSLVTEVLFDGVEKTKRRDDVLNKVA